MIFRFRYKEKDKNYQQRCREAERCEHSNHSQSLNDLKNVKFVYLKNKSNKKESSYFFFDLKTHVWESFRYSKQKDIEYCINDPAQDCSRSRWE